MTNGFLFHAFALIALFSTFDDTRSMKPLSRSHGRARKTHADSIPMTESKLADDFSDYPDIIVAIQKAGLSDSDFDMVKEFILECANSAKAIASTRDRTRFAVTAFSALTQHMITFKDCCQDGLSQLERMITNDMVIIDEDAKRFYDIQNHSDLSPDSVDVEYGLHSIREQQLSDEHVTTYKPSVLYLLLNFQTRRMSFNVLNAAMLEVAKLQKLGLHVVTVIVDPFENRQPHIDKDFNLAGGGVESDIGDNSIYSREEYDQYEKEINEIHKKPNDYNLHLEELIEKDKKDNQPKFEGIAKFDEPRIDDGKLSKNLVLQFAKEMSSIPEHGFKLDNYSQLLSSNVLNTLTGIISSPMTWFGEGEVETSCTDTRNLIHRLIWTPDYYTTHKYPNAKDCSWLITVPRGQFVSLRFDMFRTESVFDRVTIYDGETKEKTPVLGVYSGNLASEEKPFTVNSTKESVMLILETDGGNNDRGFLATWTPLTHYDQIEDGHVIFLVDVSGSIIMEDISTWIYEISKFFLLDDTSSKTGVETESEYSILSRVGKTKSSKSADKKFRYKRQLRKAKEKASSHIGIVKFAEEAEVVQSIEVPSTAEDLRDTAADLEKTEEPTFLGKALDFTRLKQFLRVMGDSSHLRSSAVDETAEFPKRAVFVLSDWHSVDDPKPFIKLLCDWNIVPIFIGFGMVNLQVRDDLVSDCGLAYQRHASAAQIMQDLKKAWRITVVETTTTPSKSTTTTTIPVKSTTISTTTDPNSLSSTTQRQYPYTALGSQAITPPITLLLDCSAIGVTACRSVTTGVAYLSVGTYPTLPPPTPHFQSVDRFDYLGLAILLAVIGVMESIGLVALILYTSSTLPPLIASISTVSMVRERKKREMIELMKLPRSERIKILKFKPPEEKVPNRPKTRYPEAVNSFFTRRAVLPKHFVAP